MVVAVKESRAAYLRGWRARKRGDFLPFQKAFVAALTRKEKAPDILGLSVPRGNGKSWLCGRLVARSLTPGDPLHEDAVENILVSSSRNQAKIVLEFARESLGDTPGFRWSDTGCVHKASRARVRIISSDSRRSLGLGAHCRLIICDEPAAWAPTAGKRLWDAMATSLGKRQTQILAVGTLAPAPLTGPGAWWPDFVNQGSADGRHISLLQADPQKWKSFDEVLRVNPVAAINPHLRRTLEREFRAALESERAARPFKQFRLNVPGDSVDAQPLVTTAEFARVVARPVPPREEKPIIGVDLGGNRSWSAACALWPNGRIESWASAPGVPDLLAQERADQVQEGTYSELVRSGGLSVDAGLAVPSVERLLSRIWAWAWEPAALVCDSYRAPELHQAVQGRVRIIERARSGGEATSNVQALRSLLIDKPSGVTEESRDLLAAAFSQTNLVIDSAGLTKVKKRDQRRSRDDASAALLLAAGELARRPAPVKWRAAAISASGEVTWY